MFNNEVFYKGAVTREGLSAAIVTFVESPNLGSQTLVSVDGNGTVLLNPDGKMFDSFPSRFDLV